MKRIAIGILCAWGVGACSDDTGILVEVHGEEIAADIARVDTMVILDDGTAVAPDSAQWGATQAIRGDVTVDLHTDPYTVMLRPDGVADDAAVWVSAEAFDANDKLVGFGEMGAMVTFSSGIVKKVALDLHPAEVTAGGACIVKDGRVVVRTTNDCDSDTVKFDVDCDDLDPQVGGDLDGDPVVCAGDCNQTSGAIYPGNVESCDGLDDDCDPATSAPPQLCVNVTTDDGGNVIECGVGEQLCNDTIDGGHFGTCLTSPLDPTSNDGLCQYWADCQAAGGDVQSCLVDGRLYCPVGVGDGPQGPAPCLAAISKQRLNQYFGFSDNACSWRLIGNVQQGAWNIGLRQADTSGPLTTFYDGCDAELVVQAAPLTAHVIVLEADLGTEIDDFAIVLDPRRDGCEVGHDSDMDCTVLP